ncbi:DUF4199 domain-containing protein [Flavobacterium sp.]|uniref:DUF4199 domain-containing protein n=1 Tax=Flavobacterium sp. TaxID=239 RepID=UPI002612CD79|nr:DUF4199 domain-containing protein [Flavobacterium sp.]
MKNIILKNGIIAGIIVSIFMGLSVFYHSKNLENPTTSYILGFTGMFLAFGFTFVGMNQYKKANNGVISFGKAFIIGFLIAFIISTIYVGVWLIEYYNFYPDFYEKFVASEIKNLQSSGLNQTELQEKIKELNNLKESCKSPLYLIMITFSEILPFGIIFSLIGAIIFGFILKKKK